MQERPRSSMRRMLMNWLYASYPNYNHWWLYHQNVSRCNGSSWILTTARSGLQRMQKIGQFESMGEWTKPNRRYCFCRHRRHILNCPKQGLGVLEKQLGQLSAHWSKKDPCFARVWRVSQEQEPRPFSGDTWYRLILTNRYWWIPEASPFFNQVTISRLFGRYIFDQLMTSTFFSFGKLRWGSILKNQRN